MAVRKRWHIALSATGASKVKSFSISQKSGIILLFILVAIITLSVFSAIYIGYNQVRIARANDILDENNKLQTEITHLSAQVDSIMHKMKQMEEWEDKVRDDKNFKKVNKEIREMGVGGIPVYDSTFVDLGKDFCDEYNNLQKNLITLNAKLDFNYESHEELTKKLDLQELLYRSTPSIYPTFGRISDPYGWRKHPVTGKRSYHNGLDLSNKTGTPIYATADGVVAKTGKKKLMGRYIQISHKFGYTTKYGHLNKILVKKGDKVHRGQIIAEMGNTGRSTGPHLHYEVLRYNKNRNPYYYLNKTKNDIVVK